MIEEIDLYGVFLPSLIVWMIVAFPVTLLVRRALAAAGVYNHVWHRPLFDTALFVVVLGAVVAIARILS